MMRDVVDGKNAPLTQTGIWSWFGLIVGIALGYMVRCLTSTLPILDRIPRADKRRKRRASGSGRSRLLKLWTELRRSIGMA